MQEFTDLTYASSPEHKDFFEVRIQRDESDLGTMKTQITTSLPYTADLTLRNIAHGITAYKMQIPMHLRQLRAQL
ncbi:hypothetical protein DPMN_087427 [Dreissena polymorpha]|uniref:Uncharacterized protein n=1 Tax=Dreissena polymorpha TaxID=45954 RepID=A0A9D4KSZ2_DREPO|nr:hypothetical protein DPMN_087427 [Dreissena polymorpha]